MSSIQTGIELNDQFSVVLNSIISSVNLAVSAMYDMQQSMNADIDTSSIEGARDEINQATAAIEAMNQAASQQTAPDIAPHIQPNAPPDTEPVEVPVTWNTDGLVDVFTGTGIERFQQEVQSANDMLNTLNTTQNSISQTAQGMDVLPDEAVADMNTMQQRLLAIQQRIQWIESNPVNLGTDTANNGLEQLRMQLNQAIQEQESLNQAMQNMDVSAANDAYLRLSQTVGNTEMYIRDNTDEQGRFNQEIQEGSTQADKLISTIKGAVAAYVSIQSVGKVLDISDELTQTTSRLAMMNDGVQSTEELVNMVYAAAQDARGSFSQMADVVARFGNNAKDAFSSSEEVVAFADLIQKQMTIAGASTQEAANAELQLSQALGSGVLRGDELNSIFEQAPNLIQNIADYLDKPIGEIRTLASEGELTADVVKAAIFAASDDINTKFNDMDMTWGQLWQQMQNTALIAFQPVLQRINKLASSQAVQNFVQDAIEAMATLANIVLNVFDMIGSVGSVIADNWSVISPIVYGVVAALGVYAAYLGIVKAIEIASAAATLAHNVLMSAKIGIMALVSGSTMAATAAQLGYNGALYACPIVWIIVLIIALIAIIVALCNWIANATGIAQSGIGVITGALATAVAFILNILIGLANYIINIGINLWNLIANFAAAFGVIFNDPVAAIKATILSMFNFIVGVVGKAASILDAVFGSNLADAVSGFQDKVQAEIDSTIENAGGTAANTLDASDYTLDRINYGDAFTAGANFGDGIADKISNFSLSDVFGSTNIPDVGSYTSGFSDAIASSGLGDNVSSVADDTGSIKDSLDVTEEDLKYLRDIAEQEAINRFTTAEINVDMSGMQNTVNSGDDIDGFMTKLTDSVNEAVDNMTEGVHE